MCLDADTIVNQDAPYYMMDNFKQDPKLGAVTGNPRIRNKSSILGKIQTIEYASLIDVSNVVNHLLVLLILFLECLHYLKKCT